MIFDVFKDFRAVSFDFIAGELRDVEIFPFGKREQYRQLTRLAVPIVLQNLLSAAVNSADVVMLNFVGQAHISAVSLATQYASVLFMILYGLKEYPTPAAQGI